MWNFLAGTAFGLIVSTAYVWYDVSLPKWVELPSVLQGSLQAAVIDDTLMDLDSSDATRRRAVEVYFSSQAKRAAVLEAELGFPLVRALQFRRARRAAKILNGQWSIYDKALAKPPLREALVRKHGAGRDEELKQQMLFAALQKKPFLKTWIERHVATPTVANLRQLLTQIGRMRNAPVQVP
ncbi:MAG: hypothetical protein ACR2PA_17105 [Hyphomicrobiaceae bacterium]